MTCKICGKPGPIHGSQWGQPGTYLNESGCHDGVWMDDDEYYEGWAPDTIYPPCPNHPKSCKKCGGNGSLRKWNEALGCYDVTDCPNKTCQSGWKGAPQWPVAAER